jgi:hypothetical protein
MLSMRSRISLNGGFASLMSFGRLDVKKSIHVPASCLNRRLSRHSKSVKKTTSRGFPSIARPVHARTRSRESITRVIDPRPALGQLLLRCLNSGIHALAMAGLRG